MARMTRDYTKSREMRAADADVDRNIGKRLRRRRKLLGLTQSQLAERVGCSFQHIQKYETAANRCTAARLFRIADAMRVPMDYFFEGLPAQKEDRHV